MASSAIDPLEAAHLKDHKTLSDSVVSELIFGLITDGAHHKQYHLERALRILRTDSYVDKAKSEYGWMDGVPS